MIEQRLLDIVIVGAGGFGREVYRWAKDSFPSTDYRIKGFLSDRAAELDGFQLDEKILGDDSRYAIQENDRFLFAIGNTEVKKRIVEQMKARSAQFLTLIHPTAVVSPSASIGEGVVICPFALVSDHAVIGDFVMMNFYSSCGHDTTVGKYTIFSPYATANGFVSIEEEVFLGTHATVTPSRKVGRGAKISANSVVLRDVPAGAFVHGVDGRAAIIFSPQSTQPRD